jgi:threonine/homoserine/homoserine lactone efflux protein
MLRALVAFAPVAALLTVTPGAATALVVRSAATGGQRRALATTIGNSVGVLAWSCFAAMGIAAVVATSAEAFTVVKLAGAVVLVEGPWLARAQRFTGAVLVGLGARLACERR